MQIVRILRGSGTSRGRGSSPGAGPPAGSDRATRRLPRHPLATATRTGRHAFLDARHRAHARVENRIVRHFARTGVLRLLTRCEL